MLVCHFLELTLFRLWELDVREVPWNLSNIKFPQSKESQFKKVTDKHTSFPYYKYLASKLQTNTIVGNGNSSKNLIKFVGKLEVFKRTKFDPDLFSLHYSAN